jgi:predicted DNA-binding protein (MmcQ/YjbR family)
LDNEESHRWQKKWYSINQLDDLDFADDIALLSHSHQQLQEKLTQDERRAAKQVYTSTPRRLKF